MKTIKFAALALAAAMSLAACSSNPDSHSSATKKNEGTTVEQSGTSSSSDSSAQTTASLSSQADQIKSSFENAGFTISDWEIESDEISFDALSENGSIEVNIEQYSSAEKTDQKYDINCADAQDDGYSQTQNWSSGDRKMSEYNNPVNSVYAIETVDTTNCTTWSIEDILEGNLESVYSVLSEFGFNK